MKVIAAKIKGSGKLLDPAKLQSSVNAALDKVAKSVQADYKLTYSTWTKVRPDAKISTPAVGQRKVEVTDKIYRMLDYGTRAHRIRPRRAKFLFFARSGFRAKTRLGWIGSSAGSRGTRDTFAREVRHPGTKPRNWTLTIYERHRLDLQKEVDKAIKAL